MAPKKTPSLKPKAKPESAKLRLQNLAARPSYEDILDEQLVDNSGVFRVTAAISQAQTGHSEEPPTRFPSDSLAIAAQRDGFPDDGPPDDGVDETAIVAEAQAAEKRARLATLTARNQARTRTRR